MEITKERETSPFCFACGASERHARKPKIKMALGIFRAKSFNLIYPNFNKYDKSYKTHKKGE